MNLLCDWEYDLKYVWKIEVFRFGLLVYWFIAIHIALLWSVWIAVVVMLYTYRSSRAKDTHIAFTGVVQVGQDRGSTSETDIGVRRGKSERIFDESPINRDRREQPRDRGGPAYVVWQC